MHRSHSEMSPISSRSARPIRVRTQPPVPELTWQAFPHLFSLRFSPSCLAHFAAPLRPPRGTPSILPCPRRQVLVRLGPLQGSIQAVPGLERIPEFGVAHGEEEQVKGVGLSLSGFEAVFERGNGLSIESVAILGHAYRVEVQLGVGRPLDDRLCELQRSRPGRARPRGR